MRHERPCTSRLLPGPSWAATGHMAWVSGLLQPHDVWQRWAMGREARGWLYSRQATEAQETESQTALLWPISRVWYRRAFFIGKMIQTKLGNEIQISVAKVKLYLEVCRLDNVERTGSGEHTSLSHGLLCLGDTCWEGTCWLKCGGQQQDLQKPPMSTRGLVREGEDCESLVVGIPACKLPTSAEKGFEG